MRDLAKAPAGAKPAFTAQRAALAESIARHGITFGQIHLPLFVAIIRTSNPYVKPGDRGILTIHETSVYGAVLVATFRRQEPDGRLSSAVGVGDVEFQSARPY